MELHKMGPFSAMETPHGIPKSRKRKDGAEMSRSGKGRDVSKAIPLADIGNVMPARDFLRAAGELRKPKCDKVVPDSKSGKDDNILEILHQALPWLPPPQKATSKYCAFAELKFLKKWLSDAGVLLLAQAKQIKDELEAFEEECYRELAHKDATIEKLKQIARREVGKRDQKIKDLDATVAGLQRANGVMLTSCNQADSKAEYLHQIIVNQIPMPMKPTSGPPSPDWKAMTP